MAKKMEVLRIFISSPGDVAEERALTKRVIKCLQGEFAGFATIEPIYWEHEPLLATETFQKQIVRPSEADVVVSILWSRLGTRLPAQFARPDGSRYSSGTEYEFEDAVNAYREKGRPELLVYRKMRDPVVSLKDKKSLLEKLSQKEALDIFFSKWFHDKAEGTLVAAFHPFETSADFEELLEVHLRKLIERRLPEMIPSDEMEPAPIQWQEGSPYRGLHVFNFEHAPIFFGRTKAVADVLDALRVQSAEGRAFVLVLGMSGGGKSSLIQAGVMPVLTQPGVIEGVGLWRRATMRPSESSGDLIDGLAASLLRKEALPELSVGCADTNELAQLLRETPKAVLPLIKVSLSQAASEFAKREQLAKQPLARLMLVIDQMEEMFTLERVTHTEREVFVKALDVLARSGQVWVVATLRSDFYPRCTELEALVALKEGSGQYDLLPPNAAEIGQMIRQPANAAGLHFEEDPATNERLDEVLRDAAARNPGGLALLEFTLEELYKQRTDHGILTHEAYKKLGGVEGALAQRAEEVYTGLEPAVKSVFGRVLRSLVSIGQREDEAITRKYASLDAVTPTAETKAFIEAFVEARLFTTDLDDEGNAVVSVAHEALLENWPRLQEWLEKNREDLRVRARVTTAASRWVEEERTRDFLLAVGKPLAEAEELIKSRNIDLSDEERTFIFASIAKRRRVWWMKRIVVAVLAVLTVIAAGMAFFANKQRERAENEAKVSTQVSDFLVDLFEVSDPSEAKGNTITARELLDQGAEKVKIELSEQPQIQARLMETMGKVYHSLGLYKEARSLLEQTLEIREQILGPEAPEVADSLEAIGSLLNSAGNYKESQQIHQRALALREKVFGPEHTSVASSLNNLANSYVNIGDYETAKPLFERAIVIWEKTLGPDSSKLSNALNNLGILLYKKGDYEEARTAYERSLAIKEKLLGPDHPDVSNILHNIGILLSDMGELGEARKYYERVLTIDEKALGPEHPYIADTINSLAILFIKEGELEKALPLFERVLEITRKALGENHQRVGSALANLGLLNFDMGNYEEARPFIEKGAAIKEKALGPDHPLVANDKSSLARLYLALGDLEKAKPLFERALVIREKALGDEHPDVAISLSELGHVLTKLGRVKEAQPLFERALAIQEKKLKSNHVDIAINLNNYAGLLYEMKNYERAISLYERALAIKEEALGADHPEVALSLRGYARLLTDTGDSERARSFFERALRIQEEKLGSEHPEVVETLEAYANLLHKIGRKKEAEELEARAKKIRAKKSLKK